jgi:hypothetical protein
MGVEKPGYIPPEAKTESRREFLARLFAKRNVGIEREGTTTRDKPEKIISRREFLKQAVELGAFGALYLALKEGGAYALETIACHEYKPTKGEEAEETTENEQENQYYAGFVEQNIKTSFFDSEDGYMEWTHEALNVPIVHETVADVIESMVNLPEGEEARFGDVVITAVESARRRLREEYPGLRSNNVVLDMESFHIGAIALGQTFNRRWESTELEQIRQERNLQYDSRQEQFFDRQGLLGQKYPRLFGETTNEQSAGPEQELRATEETIRTGGKDRSFHAAGHLLLTTEYVYSSKHQLGLDRELPRAIRTYLDTQGGDAFEQAHQLSEVTGFLYEVKSTWSTSGLALRPEVRTAGLMDPEEYLDIKGNRLGANVGLWVMGQFEQGKTWEEIRPIIETLNDPRWISSETEPDFPPKVEG